MQTPGEEIEIKILNFLRKAKAPNMLSQIAAHIQCSTDETAEAIERLLHKGAVKRVTDFTLLRITGETSAFVLAG